MLRVSLRVSWLLLVLLAACGGEVLRLDAARLDDDALRAALASPLRPVVVSNLVRRLLTPSFEQWSPGEVARLLGAAPVTMNITAGYLADYLQVYRAGFRPSHTQSLGDFVARMDREPHRAELLFEHEGMNPELHRTLRRHVTLPPSSMSSILGDASLPMMLLTMGTAGAGVPMHHHDEAWLAQLTGAKRWWFLPPDADLSTLTPRQYRAILLTPPSHWPAELLARPPAGSPPPEPTAVASMWSHDVFAGEMIFLPRGWYHGTSNLGPGVAIGQMGVPGPHDATPALGSEALSETESVLEPPASANVHELLMQGRAMLADVRAETDARLLRRAVERFLAPAVRAQPLLIREGLVLALRYAHLDEPERSRCVCAPPNEQTLETVH